MRSREHASTPCRLECCFCVCVCFFFFSGTSSHLQNMILPASRAAENWKGVGGGGRAGSPSRDVFEAKGRGVCLVSVVDHMCGAASISKYWF